MTDNEIKQYLDKNNWSVNAQDCVMKVFNTTPKIRSIYNSENNIMTIITKNNEFTFKWNLGNPFSEEEEI